MLWSEILKKIISFCFFLFLSTSCFADGRTFGFFAGVGELYAPKSYRVSFSNWEVGLLLDNDFGIIQNYYSGNSYISFGLITDLYNGGAGPFGAFGYDFTFAFLGNSLYLKTELNTATTYKNFSKGSFLLGLGIYW